MWVVQVTLVGPLDLTLFDCDAYADSLQLCSCAVTTRVESKTVQKITDNFTSRGVGRILVKWACTGIAASAVDSQTLHLIAMIPLHGRKQLAEVLKLLELYWQDKHYLIIDKSPWSRVSSS